MRFSIILFRFDFSDPKFEIAILPRSVLWKIVLSSDVFGEDAGKVEVQFDFIGRFYQKIRERGTVLKHIRIRTYVLVCNSQNYLSSLSSVISACST